MRPLTMTPGDWATLVFLSVLWGGSFFFVEVAGPALPPLTLVLARVGLAAVALQALVFALGRARRLPLRVWGALALLALANNLLPFLLFVWAQQTIPGGLAATLNATTPLWAVLVAHLFTADERATPLKIAGVLLGFGGVAVMLAGDLGGTASLLPQAACLLAAALYALGGVYGRRFQALGLDPLAIAANQITCSAALLLPFALAVDRPWTLPAPGADAVAAVVALALLSTALAYILFFRLLARAATNLLLVTFLIPVTAILLGVLFLGETLGSRQLAGMALIAAGLLAIDGRLLRRRPRALAPGRV